MLALLVMDIEIHGTAGYRDTTIFGASSCGTRALGGLNTARTRYGECRQRIHLL